MTPFLVYHQVDHRNRQRVGLRGRQRVGLRGRQRVGLRGLSKSAPPSLRDGINKRQCAEISEHSRWDF